LWFARVDPQPRSPITGLAIVRSAGSACYLFGCDREWGSLFDTWHPTAEHAMEQAAFQFEGKTVKWTSLAPPVNGP
jgi:hypothetical protein